MMKTPIIIIAGPTASGKTAIGIELAKVFDGEIISADSMQIYKKLNINTAKATPEEQAEVPHHMIDVVEPYEEFSVTDFKERAEALIKDISSRGKLPIIVGGTGMYIKALLTNYSYGKSLKNESIREKYNQFLQDSGPEALHQLLKNIDPVSASEIHPNNTKRVIRALEIYEETGRPKSEQKDTQAESIYNDIMIVLDIPRDQLYERINQRVAKMINAGGVEEAKAVYNDFNLPNTAQCLQAIGYKEFLPYLNNEATLDEVSNNLAQATRNYAKRQLTFFRSFKDAVWLNPLTQKDKIISYIKEKLNDNKWKNT